jgi:hypothetical protein
MGNLGVMNVESGGQINLDHTLEVVSSEAANRLNLSGGAIVAGALNFNGNPSLFNWTTGLSSMRVASSAAMGAFLPTCRTADLSPPVRRLAPCTSTATIRNCRRANCISS